MSKKDTVKRVIVEFDGIARTADFLKAGLTKADIYALINEGYLQKIRHGYYHLTDITDISEEQLLASLLPEGIVCMESALFHYGYSDYSPRIWTIAVPRTISRTKLKIEAVAMKIYYVPNDHFETGRTSADFNGVILSVYDRERTICDCFKYRSRLDNETFSKAIHSYVEDEKKDLRNLSRYAKELGLFKKVNDLMEVMLNG